jgi:hypothetical protein
MFNEVPVEATAPFPPLPKEAAGGHLRLRRFGTCFEDLEVDLQSVDRPCVITNVLAACTMPGRDADFFWDLPVSKRTECLLLLAGLGGAGDVDAEYHCPECRQTLEVSLTLDELLAVDGSLSEPVSLVGDDGAVTSLRRPTGRDQAGWAAKEFADERALHADMASCLAGGAVFDEAQVTRIEQALDEADPLLRGAVEASCPECGCVSQHEVDLAGFALAQLRRAQDALIQTVHLLASRYHWSEAEILATPPWRRARYTALLERESSE